MFDAKLRPIIDPPLNYCGRIMANTGISANQITIAGAVFGVASGFAIANENYVLGLGLILLSRIFDGLDGAIARATKNTDFGGYLDILCDFVFYLAVPIGFAFANSANILPALLLIASFTLTGISFLAFATLAAKNGIETEAHGTKSFFYNTGIAEGAETILVFVVMCLVPDRFALIAYVYAVVCIVTVIQRTMIAKREFGG
ncbi:MAG: CDP-alcohol phosphatidyltransferase [Hyphomonadaceae bacterium]|nr:MAG: CDP-alcohol phosphatidyltransferase [Hyphomonadaceae bacterium]KAF0183825.1 MAG: CDP-alcohol phosphatidyltransferase [Hyphomonadaceae bacterium]